MAFRLLASKHTQTNCPVAARLLYWAALVAPPFCSHFPGHQLRDDWRRWNSGDQGRKINDESKNASRKGGTKAQKRAGYEGQDGAQKLPPNTDATASKQDDNQKVQMRELFDKKSMMGVFSSYFWTFHHKAMVAAIQAFVEKDFDDEDFMEGAKDAYWMVLYCFSHEAYQDLAGMVSQRILSTIRHSHEDLRSRGMTCTMMAPAEIDASIVHMNTISSDKIRRFFEPSDLPLPSRQPEAESRPTKAGQDSPRPYTHRPHSTSKQQRAHGSKNAAASSKGSSVKGAAEPLHSSPSPEGNTTVSDASSLGLDEGKPGLWLQVFVKMKSAMECKYYNKEGQLVDFIVDYRGHTLTFARRMPHDKAFPLNERLTSPWIVLTWT